MAVVFEDRRSRVEYEKKRAINTRAFVALSIPGLLGFLMFAIAIANGMQQSENWTAGVVAVVVAALLVVAMFIGRRHDAGPTK